MAEAPPQSDLLDESTVVDYLRGRELVSAGPAVATMLTGGVSNVVLLVEQGSHRLVLKQALAQLRVADDWFADPSRAEAEGAALRIFGGLAPGELPRLLDSDPARHTIVIEAAPTEWITWKAELLSGVCRPRTALWLGSLLARWHEGTADLVPPPELDGTEAFEQLRLRPYFDVSARRRPDLAAPLQHYRTELLTRRRCLISGDFSPKNVLVGPDRGWAIDLEVAHRGDPTFDVAFLMHHLLLKGVHLRDHRPALRACIDAFIDGYGSAPGVDDRRHLHGLIACLLLARIVGSSPVDYLDAAEARQVEAAATRLLTAPPAELDEVCSVVAGS